MAGSIAYRDDTAAPIRIAEGTISSTEILALNATPIAIIAAPGAGKANILQEITLYHAGGTAYAGIAAGEDIAFKYTDGSGQECFARVETTGLLDQTATQTRHISGASGAFAAVPTDGLATPTANAAIVIQILTGEITTGNFALKYRAFYRTIDLVF